MKIKNTAAPILAAAAMTTAATVWAVDAAPASVPQITENAQPQVGMSAATAAAEETYGGQTRSARLHDGRGYGHRGHDRNDCGFGHGFGFHGGRACR